MVTIVPVNRRILPIWSNVWMLLFILATGLVVAPIAIETCWEDTKSWNFGNWGLKTVGNYVLVVGLFTLFSIYLWDLILYWLRSGRPLKKLLRSGILPGNVPELSVTRRNSRSVMIIDFLGFICVLFVIFCVLLKKETSYFGDTVKDKYLAWADFDSNDKYFVFIGLWLVFWCGLISFWLKHKLTERWDICMWSYPQKPMGSFIRPKPGVSCLWVNHISFWISITSSFLAILVGMQATGKYSILQSLKLKPGGGAEIHNSTPLWQLFCVAIGFIGFLLILSCLAKMYRSSRDMKLAASRGELFTEKAYSFAVIRKSLNLVTFWLCACICAWVATFPLIILMNNDITKKTNAELQYAAAFTSACLFLFSLCLFVVQHTARVRFEQCCLHGTPIKRSKRILDPIDIRKSVF